jgi:enoyl-CoA hydratase/carnithine racemase
MLHAAHLPARYETDGPVATVTLDRDDKRNAFDAALSDAVAGFIRRAEAEGLRAVILRANDRAKIFSAGHDLAEMAEHGVQDGEADPYWRMIACVRDTKLPVIAAIGAPVLAGGVILALVADITIATPAATATMTANRMGVPFRTELYAALAHGMGLKKAKELMLTAAPLTPEECLRCGLYNHVVPQRELMSAAREIALRIAALVPEGVAASKRALNALAWAPGLDAQTAAELDRARLDRLASPDLAARVAALLAGLKR